jgi:hypothetical protein
MPEDERLYPDEKFDDTDVAKRWYQSMILTPAGQTTRFVPFLHVSLAVFSTPYFLNRIFWLSRQGFFQ